jgi:hypothetical protein
MLLLVVGLVVLVLVIVVVVFLSVRSMRADDDEEYPARPARRQSSGRDRAQQRRGAGTSRPGASQNRASQNRAGQSRAAGDYQNFQTAALPRPRGAQHDQDLDDAPRRRGSRPVSRAAAGRNRSGGDWSDSDWGDVSDEQYWAEMSSDKPLTTTARSAQAGSDAARQDLGDRDAAAVFPDRPEPTGNMAGAVPPAASRATAGLRRQPGGGLQPEPAGQPEEPAGFGSDSFRDEGSFRGGDGYRDDLPVHDLPVHGLPTHGGRADNSTDPGLGGPGGWSGADEARTATWSADETPRWTGDDPARDVWERQDQPTSVWETRSSQAGSRDSGGHDQAPASGGWTAEDPLTSPSFAAQDGYGTDARSYRDSNDRAQDQAGHAAGRYDDGYQDQSGYGFHQNGYEAHQRGYGADRGYPSGGLEPLPDPAASGTAPRETWHSAPVPTETQHGYTEPVSQGWDQASSRYQDDPSYQDASSSYQTSHEDQAGGYGYGQQPGYDSASHTSAIHDSASHTGAGYGYEPRQDYPGAGSQNWQDTQAGYGQDSASHNTASHNTAGYGYGQQPGYDSASHNSGGYGYEQQQGYGAPAASDYGHVGYDQGQADDGYGERGQHGRHGDRSAPGYSPEFDIGRRR